MSYDWASEFEDEMARDLGRESEPCDHPECHDRDGHSDGCRYEGSEE